MIQVNRLALLSEAKRASNFINHKAVMPMLRGLVLQASSAGTTRLTATDIDSYYASAVPDTWHPALSVVVNAKELVEALRNMATVTVGLASDGGTLTLSALGASVKLKTLGDPVDYPVPPVSDRFEPVVTLTEPMVAVLQQKLAPVADQTTITGLLHAICLKPSSKPACTGAAATDGSRMVTADFSATYSLDKPLLIPSSVIVKAPDEAFSISFDSVARWIRLSGSDFDIYSRRIDGEYPSYEQIMPPVGESQGYRVYDRKELVAACKAVLKSSAARKSKDNPRPVNTICFVGLQAADFTADVTFDMTGQSSDNRAIGLNPNYLLDWLTTQETDRVELLLTGAQNNKETHYCKPVMLLDDQYNDHGVRHLLMPVQVKSDWADKHACSIEQSCEPVENAPAAPVRLAKRAKTVKPVAAKREPINAAPAPVQPAPSGWEVAEPSTESEPVVSAPCAHLRKLIRDHVLTCRDCKCVVAALK